MSYKFGATLPTFASCADRYCLSGYGGGGTTIKEMMDLAVNVPDLEGVEIVGNWHVNNEIVDEVKSLAKEHNLQISMIAVDLWTQAKWGKGSLASTDAAVRSEAVAEIKRSMDWAAAVGCPYVDVWLGQDGYDYYLQADYASSWKNIVSGLKEVADYRADVMVLVEYKMKEPRTHCFISTVGKTLLLLNEVGSRNLRVLLDIGHATAGGENPAESVALMNGLGEKNLEYLHFNDNYHGWDDDMLVGSVHLPELVEVMYWLKRTEYDGWLTLDIFPYREDGVGSATESIKWIKSVSNRIDDIGMDRIADVISANDGVASTRLLREFFLR